MTSNLISAIRPHLISNSDLDQEKIYNILNNAEHDKINYSVGSILIFFRNQKIYSFSIVFL